VTDHVVSISDGQASATVPGPLHDGDTAHFVVPAPKPAFDVLFPGPLTSSTLTAFIKAHPGKVIGLPGGKMTAVLQLTGLTASLVQTADITSTVDASPGAVFLRGCTLVWDLGGHQLVAPITLDQIAGKSDGAEQHHGIRQDGGRVVIQNGTIGGVWGDAVSARAWAVANGGDGAPPVSIVRNVLLETAGRCGLSWIQAAAGSLAENVSTKYTGAWGIDLETNSSSDQIGAVTIRGGHIGAHGIGANPDWATDDIIAAIQIAGGKSSKPLGPIAIDGVTADQFDIVAVHVGDLTLRNLTSAKPARIIVENVDALHKSGLQGIV